MKISTINAAIAALSTIDFADKDAVLADLNAELHRNDAAKEAKSAEYATAHDIVLETIRCADSPVTVAEIYASCVDNLPEGFSKNKISYALRVLWADEVTVTEGKVKSYAVKA